MHHVLFIATQGTRHLVIYVTQAFLLFLTAAAAGGGGG